MRLGVDFNGVKVTVETSPGETVESAVRSALQTIFPPEMLPPIDGCAVSLCGSRVSLSDVIEVLPEGSMLEVTLPF